MYGNLIPRFTCYGKNLGTLLSKRNIFPRKFENLLIEVIPFSQQRPLNAPPSSQQLKCSPERCAAQASRSNIGIFINQKDD